MTYLPMFLFEVAAVLIAVGVIFYASRASKRNY